MQEIIAELGLAGYGRANVLLETLARHANDDGQFVFQLPLARPTDIKFWTREFRQTTEQVEHTFDIFEQAALIQPWRKSKTICAPMLGARVDEWTKRKNKARSPRNRKVLENGNEHENEDENEHQHENEIERKEHNITPEALGSCSGVPKPASPSSSNLPTAVPKPKIQNQNLADVAVATAVETNPAARISGKSKAEIARIIGETNATEEELIPIVQGIVEKLDEFQLRNAGSFIAASLAGHVMAMRKKKTEADNQAVVHEKEMRVVQEEIAARERDWKEKVAKAKAEEDRLRQHYPDDSFCACPQCQPSFWKEEREQFEASV